MPKAANMPAPVSAPPTRAKSDVVRATPVAAVNSWEPTMPAIMDRRTPRSEGRTIPVAPAIRNTMVGVRPPASATVTSIDASTA